MSRNVTADVQGDAGEERYRLYRLCACAACDGRGKVENSEEIETEDEVGWRFGTKRCDACRGEGRIRELVATATDPESMGVALVTLGREGEWDECPIGILDTEGETGKKWLVSPWQPSARNVTDAARTLAKSKGKGKA
jgi:hypothetical protein